MDISISTDSHRWFGLSPLVPLEEGGGPIHRNAMGGLTMMRMGEGLQCEETTASPFNSPFSP